MKVRVDPAPTPYSTRMAPYFGIEKEWGEKPSGIFEHLDPAGGPFNPPAEPLGPSPYSSDKRTIVELFGFTFSGRCRRNPRKAKWSLAIRSGVRLATIVLPESAKFKGVLAIAHRNAIEREGTKALRRHRDVTDPVKFRGSTAHENTLISLVRMDCGGRRFRR